MPTSSNRSFERLRQTAGRICKVIDNATPVPRDARRYRSDFDRVSVDDLLDFSGTCIMTISVRRIRSGNKIIVEAKARTASRASNFKSA
jgi:hypothetical protein